MNEPGLGALLVTYKKLLGVCRMRTCGKRAAHKIRMIQARIVIIAATNMLAMMSCREIWFIIL